MTNETMVTVQGWVANEPILRIVGGTPVLNFRIGATPRRFSKKSNEWADGQTQWYGVSAWRHLAENGERSLEKGDPVFVHGRLNHRTYVNNQGVEVVALEIDAVTVGHDLSRGSSRFRKVTRVLEQPRELPDPPDFGGSAATPPEDPWAGTIEADSAAAEVEGAVTAEDSQTAA